MQISDGPDFNIHDVPKIEMNAKDSVNVFNHKLNAYFNSPTKENITQALTAAVYVVENLRKEVNAITEIADKVSEHMLLFSVLLEKVKEKTQ